MEQIGKAYAEALFALASEADACKAVKKGLARVMTAFSDYPELVSLLSCPAIEARERACVCERIFGAFVPPLLLSMLCLACEKRQTAALVFCAERYGALYDAQSGMADAVVKTAYALSDGERERLVRVLEQKSGRRVRLACVVDPSLLGGMAIEMDGYVQDGTLRERWKRREERIR